MKYKKHKTKGFSLLESLVYMAILSLMTVIIINILVSTAKAYNILRLARSINNSAITSLERMTREIKSADNISMADSTFGTHPGKLKINISADTKEFYIDNGTLKIKETGVDKGALTLDGVSVDNLVFRNLDNGTSKAVRIEMTLSGTHRNITNTKKFYSFVVLRN
ncbi:MAG: prepilin-type N-terminal cleavage/methylation domain-containing protein [Patescibacteria group bacterium]